MPESYDVIIIGTGAGGDARQHAGADGQEDLAARARRLPAPTSIGAVSPAMTAMANPIRVGEQLADLLG